MSLLTDLAVVGTAGVVDSVVMFWQADGTINGFIDTEEAVNILAGEPAGTGNDFDPFDSGAVAVDSATHRIYINLTNPRSAFGSIPRHADGHTCVLVCDGDGTPLTVIFHGDDDSNAADAYALCIPRTGRIWIASDTFDVPRLYEYDSSGTFRGVVETFTDGNFTIAYGLMRRGRFMYFNTLSTGTGAGIWRYDRVTESLAQLVPGGSGAGTADRFRGVAMMRNGDLVGTQHGAVNTVHRYNLSGVLQQTYTFTDAEVFGIAADPDGLHFWVGDSIGGDLVHANPLIRKVRASDGVIVASFSAVSSASTFNGGEFAGSALCTPFAPILAPSPCSFHTHDGIA